MHLRLLALAALVLALLAGFNLADEPAPAKGKEPPANIQLDQAKTLRLGKLLENLHVLNELNVGDEAYARLEDVKDQERLVDRRQSEELNRELKATRDLPAAEKAERMRTFFQIYQAGQNASAETFAFQRFGLLTGPQMERLNQLDLQDQGIGAFFAEDVVAALKLSGDQQQRIEDIRATYEPKFLLLIKSPIYTESIVVRSTQPAIIELLKERTAKVEQVLSKEQVDKLAELRGKTFELSRMGRALGEIPDLNLTRPRVSPFLQSMLSHEAVRKDLQLSPEEEAGITAALARHQQAIQEIYGPAARAKAAAEPEQLSAVQKALQNSEQFANRIQQSLKIERELADELAKHLKDAHVKRLKQINFQRGLRYAIGPDGRDELGLTSDQMQKIMSIQMDNRRQQSGFLVPRPPLNPEATREFFAKQLERRQEQQKKEDAQLLEVLTPEQRQKLKELQGPPFDISLIDPARQIPSRPAPPVAKPVEEEKSKP